MPSTVLSHLFQIWRTFYTSSQDPLFQNSFGMCIAKLSFIAKFIIAAVLAAPSKLFSSSETLAINVPFRLQIFSRFSFSIRFSRYGLLWISASASIKWRRRDSNSWPPACKAGALPTELRPHSGGSSSAFGPSSANGLKWTRTTDLTLIRRAL